jgi:hypothetical protein
MEPTTRNDLQPPDRPDEQDRLLDLRLATLPRFDPSPGFADRVMARVWISRPALATVPWHARAWTFSARIKRFAAALGVVAATSSSLLTLWAAFNFQLLAQTASRYASAFAAASLDQPLRRLVQWFSWLTETGTAVATGAGWPAAAAIVAGGLAAIPLSILGLYLLSRSPQPAGRVSHARR